MADKQMCVCRAERVAGDGGGLGTEILRVKSDGTRYKAPNIDPKRSHLNRTIISCGGRDGNAIRAAIDRRIREAGVARKITKDQCRAVVMYLSGTHDQMAKIEADGLLDDWVEDSRRWLEEQWGADNIVALELHRDEYTPHLHVVVVPITTEARRRRGREDNRSRYQVKPKVRLSADHYLTKRTMRQWQNSYAERMAKYDLERGVVGSRARHQTMNEYYRHLREDLIPKAEQNLRDTEGIIRIRTATLGSLDDKLRSKQAALDNLDQEIRSMESVTAYKRMVQAAVKVYPRISNVAANLDMLEMLGLPLQRIQELYRDGAIRYTGRLHDYKTDDYVDVTDLLIEIIRSTAGDMLVWLARKTPSMWLDEWRRGAAARERHEIHKRNKAAEQSRRPSLDDIMGGRKR